MRNSDVSPKTYKRVENSTLVELLPDLNDIRMNMEGDAYSYLRSVQAPAGGKPMLKAWMELN